MTYPIPVHLRRSIFLVTLLLTVVVFWLMDAPLKTEHAPFGIVSLELARYPEIADRVITSWDVTQQAAATTGVYWDFLWLLCYSTTISLACVWAAGVFSRSSYLVSIGYALAWLLWLAALLDVAENVALLQMLGGATQPPWPALAYWCALAKFDIIFLGLVYVLAGAVAWLLGRRTKQSEISR
jgi:hypothetical protein